jgi:hypothetical protein
VLLALLLLSPLAVQASEAPQCWELRDSSGVRWALVLFQQPDPAFPDGWRLRRQASRPFTRCAARKALAGIDGGETGVGPDAAGLSQERGLNRSGSCLQPDAAPDGCHPRRLPHQVDG